MDTSVPKLIAAFCFIMTFVTIIFNEYAANVNHRLHLELKLSFSGQSVNPIIKCSIFGLIDRLFSILPGQG